MSFPISSLDQRLVSRQTRRPLNRLSVTAIVERLEHRALLTATLTPISASVNLTAGVPPSSPVAIGSFLDSDPNAMPGDFTATISWGDGNTSAGTVTQLTNSGTSTRFQVTGTNTYPAPSIYTVSIQVQDFSNDSATITSTAYVVTPAAASALTIGANAISGIAGEPLASTTTVATFFSPDGTNTSSDFNALISWGDGQTSAGTVQGANGVFTVTGSNTYAVAGTYITTVRIAGVGTAASASATGVATISNSTAATFSFSGELSAIGNGSNFAGGYTNTNQPTFTGTALPFSTVVLYAKPHGIDTSLPLGETVANASGQWTLNTGPLAALTYTVTATVTPSGGYPSNMMLLTTNNGVVHVDMVPKHVKLSR